MKPTTLPTLLMLLASLSTAEAHTRFTTLHINGQSQGDGVCIRQDQNPGTTTNYVPSIKGSEMACGTDGSIANPKTCSANAGDQISLEHRMWPDGSQPGAIDVSHKGSTAVYMKKINSESDEVSGNGWFKIYFDGYNSGEWGTTHMNANNGLVTTTIPNDLASGSYLVRSEVLALQEVGEPQMYVGCAQLTLSGTGSAVPADTATIPGYIDMSTPSMKINIYESFTFSEFGPKVYGAGGSGNGTAVSSKPSTTTSLSLDSSASGTLSAVSGPATGSVVAKPNTSAASTTSTATGTGQENDAYTSNSDYNHAHGNEHDTDEDEDEIEDQDEDDDEDNYQHHHRNGHNHGSQGHRWAAWNNEKARSWR